VEHGRQEGHRGGRGGGRGGRHGGGGRGVQSSRSAFPLGASAHANHGAFNIAAEAARAHDASTASMLSMRHSDELNDDASYLSTHVLGGVEPERQRLNVASIRSMYRQRRADDEASLKQRAQKFRRPPQSLDELRTRTVGDGAPPSAKPPPKPPPLTLVDEVPSAKLVDQLSYSKFVGDAAYRLNATETVRRTLRSNQAVVLRCTPVTIGVDEDGGQAPSNRDARLLLTSLYTEMMPYCDSTAPPPIRIFSSVTDGSSVSESILYPHRKYADADLQGLLQMNEMRRK